MRIYNYQQGIGYKNNLASKTAGPAGSLANIEYKNSIPVVKNDSPDPPAAGFTPSSTDSVIIDSIYGGNKEITKEDALLYKYRQENPISIFDTYQQYAPITDASQISENFIDQINQEDVKCWDIFRFQFAIDFNEYGDDLEENLRSLAAAYVTARDHLNTHFTGSKLEGYMGELESTISEMKHNMAGFFAHNVGSFLDESGSGYESEKIYSTILSEYDKMVGQYTDFIEKNNDYAHLEGTKDAWLINDVAYMSQQLKKAFGSQPQTEVSSGSAYSLDEIALANRLVREVNSTQLFKSLGNEESVGFEAGILLLKTKLFTENSHVSSKFGEMVAAAVKRNIDQKIDQENARIYSMYDAPYYDKEANPAYQKSAIDQVSSKMLSIFSETKGDYIKTILQSIEYAHNKSSGKANKNGGPDRYKHTLYWDRFYENSDTFSSMHYIEIKGADKKTEFERLAESWNSFAYFISGSDDCQLKINSISFLI